MKLFTTLAAALATSILFPIAALAEPSTCWSSHDLASNGDMKAFDCDVELINKHNPDAVFRRTGQSHWVVEGMRIFLDFKEDTATVYFDNGNAKEFFFKVDQDLDYVLTGKQDYTFVFAPSEGFKEFLRAGMNQDRPQPARHSGPRSRDVLSDTPFRF
jgi:hypothetical protein